MQEYSKFPSWIIDVEQADGSKLNHHSRDFFKKALECYPNFYETFLNCPKTCEIGVLNSHEPWVLEEYYKTDNLFHFVVANIAETFHFEFVYQVRELALGMHDALENGAFFTAAILNRSIFELVCTYYYYTFDRVEEKFKQSLRILRAAARTRSKAEQQKNVAKHYEILYEIYS